MASGCKGSTRPGSNVDTTLYTCAGSACVVNVSACNDHASTADTIEIYVVWSNSWCPNGDSSWEDADGTRGTYNAQTGCSETFYPDGGRDTYCSDGSGSYTNANGETDISQLVKAYKASIVILGDWFFAKKTIISTF